MRLNTNIQNKLRFGVLLGTLVLLMGNVACVSMSSLQTARTLEEGKDQQTLGGGVYHSKDKIGDLEYESNLPYIEYSYRRGFYKDIDAGLKLTFVGSYVGDVKYQLFQNDKWAVAMGLGVGYMSYKVTSGSQESNVKFVDMILPLYLSYDVSKSFSLYATPKYIYRSISGDASGSDSIVGGALGTKIGEKSGVYLEAALVKGKDSNSITQYNLSYFW